MGTTVTTQLGLIKPDRQEPMPNWPWQNLINSIKLDNKVRVTFGSWTPVLTGSVSDPDLGVGGVIEGKFARIANRLVFAYGRYQFGTSGIDVGSGTYRFTLPSTPDTSIYNIENLAAFDIIGSWIWRDDDTAGGQHMGGVFIDNVVQDAVVFTYGYQSGDNIGSADPVPPEIEDSLSFYCFYQEESIS